MRIKPEELILNILTAFGSILILQNNLLRRHLR